MEAIEQNDDKTIYVFTHKSNKTDCKLELRFNDTFRSTENYSRGNAY